ncbi:MAG: 23S rRNA pseudouridine synthase F, partial [Bacteroidia bacterium]|nr:23S rRNA pseudouridine synthase F [Bacteroidia bacterium]
ILDTVTRNCKVEKINSTTFKIVLTQGLNRQIRRMCEYLDYEVRSLRRTRIMNIELDLPIGKYRELTKQEFETLNKMLESSSKTTDFTSKKK